MLLRRAFLKLAGASAVAAYAEPMIALESARHEWVEDRGDFYLIRVPDFKTFARESLDKPTILILGASAKALDVLVDGYLNVFAPAGGLVSGFFVDGRNMRTEKARSAVFIKGDGLTFRDSYIESGAASAAISLDNW